MGQASVEQHSHSWISALREGVIYSGETDP